MKKKALSLLLIAAMTASMAAGCGSNAGTDAGSNAGSDAGSAADTQAAADDQAAADTQAAADDQAADAESTDEEAWAGTITVWSPQEDQDSGWLSAQCDAFNAAHPNWDITFEYGVCAEGDAKGLVTTDVEGSADVYMYANDNITDLVAANALAELGGTYLESVTSTNSEAIVNSVSLNGSVYGFPFTTNTWYMYYDKSVYSEEDVKSLDTMLEKGVVSFPLTNSWYIASFYVANGCTLFGPDQMDEAAGIDFSGDKAVAVTNYLVDLAANPNFINDADGAGIAGLRDGSINAMFSGSWDASSVKDALGDNFAAAALPCVTIDGNSVQMKAFAGSKAVGVNPNTENPQVAMSLAEYLTSADAQQAHYEMRSVVPCNTELLANITDDAVVSAQNDTYDNTSITQPFVGKMGLYWSPAENMGKAIIAGEVTHDNAADKTEEMNTAMNTDVAQ